MLFILAMDVLHRLVTKACADGVLQPMETQGVRFQCSLYADDVILFIRPTVQEAIAVKEILTIFGGASGLRTNLNKCSITPIFGAQEALDDIVQILGCQVQQFPLQYLGLPMTTSKIPKAEFQALVESVTRKMPTCHGSLMARSGRLIWIKSVLRAIPIYSMMAENLRAWARNEIDNVCRKFLWAGKDASVRGKCMVAWEACCRPTELGDLASAASSSPASCFKQDGYGFKKLIIAERGVSCQSKPTRRYSCSSELQLSWSWATTRLHYSGKTAGFKVRVCST
jgi:hypothetical protein